MHKVRYFLHRYLRSPRLLPGFRAVNPPTPLMLKDPYVPVKPLNQEVSNQRNIFIYINKLLMHFIAFGTDSAVMRTFS